ncbi:MAG TPA: hypothetical protein PJ986_07385 [Gammaproteobacteria bacterium]|nr:hypothetical protein [Gammaproteobacteria bacterium]
MMAGDAGAMIVGLTREAQRERLSAGNNVSSLRGFSGEGKENGGARSAKPRWASFVGPTYEL